MRRHFLALLSVSAFSVAVIPFMLLVWNYFARLPDGLPIAVLVVLNFIGWAAVCVLYIAERNMLDSVDKTSEALGFSVTQGSLENKLGRFLVELKRFARASLDFAPNGMSGNKSLWTNLYRIALTTKKELNANAVELALFDEASGLWTQAILVGNARTRYCQSMLLETKLHTAAREIDSDETFIIMQPVSFSGTLFGSLRVEFGNGVRPTLEDRQILKILANQGALLLVDARFTDEVLRMRKAGEESVRAKTGFLANLSHEIRGPLGIILNGVEIVTDGLCGPVTESQRETLGMIKQNGDHLLDLVNDVLDYAKVEAGKIKAKPVSLAVKPLLSDLANVVRSQAMGKKQKLKVEPVDESLAILCDKRHARQILINILTNAIKYTPNEGRITVSSERITGNRIKISVADTGIGIPESERDKVFGAFERVDDKYAQSQIGTGLGMPLTKRLLEVNKGYIDFTSVKGEGSTFWMILPAGELPKEIAQEEEISPNRMAQGRGEHILLVEKEGEERDMLQRYLIHQGFEISLATTDMQVVGLMREKSFAIAIVECDLPSMSGEDIVGIIRNNPTASNLPVIVLSSKAFVFDIERYLKLGVDRCLSKPVELSEIAMTTRQLIDEARATT